MPTLNDFERLDARFTLPRATWDKIAAYRDYGFAVFKLRNHPDGPVHPMAFEFATRDPQSLFLPTVHIHDGQVHEREKFDHALYVQDARLRPTDERDSWGSSHPIARENRLRASYAPAARFMNVRKAKGLIDPAQIVLKRPLYGTLPNRDTIIPVA